MGDYTGKAKVEKVEQTDRGGYSIKLTGGYDGNVLFTGYQGKGLPKLPFPDHVKEGVELDVVVVTMGEATKEWYAVSFPTAQNPTPQASGWKGGYKEDTALKLTSFAFSYAKDLYVATSGPESKLDDLVATANKLADAMQATHARLK